MTAIVGVLNKQAVAVAADSAITIGSGRKIYNTANKIFTLSKRHPVGVAIYGNARFNSSIPWEIVIKMYRDQLGDTTKPTIREYASDFFDFLEEVHFFVDFTHAAAADSGKGNFRVNLEEKEQLGEGEDLVQAFGKFLSAVD